MDKKKSLGILAVAAAALLLLTAVVAGPSEAARGTGGGGGGGHKGGGTSSGTLTVSPNMVPLGATSVTISGSGFGANQGLVINTSMFPQPWITTLGDGTFSIVYSPSGTFWAAGPASVQALNPSTMAVLATGLYTVCATSPC